MDNLEKNALRIAELMGWRYNPIFQQNTLDCNTYFADAVKISSNDELIELYSDYQGLMPIVFEANQSDYISFTMTSASFHVTEINTTKPMKDRLNNYAFDKSEEESFIEALQLACIKYLELK